MKNDQNSNLKFDRKGAGFKSNYRQHWVLYKWGRRNNNERLKVYFTFVRAGQTSLDFCT